MSACELTTKDIMSKDYWPSDDKTVTGDRMTTYWISVYWHEIVEVGGLADDDPKYPLFCSLVCAVSI